MYFPLFVGVMCLSLFCNALLCVHFSFAIILKRKIKLVASYRCIVTINVLWLFLTMPWAGLPYVMVVLVFPDHTSLLFVTVGVMWLFTRVLCIGLQRVSCIVILLFPVHTRLLFQ